MNFDFIIFHFADGSKETFCPEGYITSLEKALKIAEKRNTTITGYEVKFKEEEE